MDPLHHLSHLLRSLSFRSAIDHLTNNPHLSTATLPNGHTPLQFACLLGNVPLVHHLLAHHKVPPDPTALLCASISNAPCHAPCNAATPLSHLLPSSPCPSSSPCVCPLGAGRALHAACWGTQKERALLILTRLCPRGKRSAIAYVAANATTCLHGAVLGGSPTLVEELIRLGVDVTITSAEGYTASALAKRYLPFQHGNDHIVKLLAHAEKRHSVQTSAEKEKEKEKGHYAEVENVSVARDNVAEDKLFAVDTMKLTEKKDNLANGACVRGTVSNVGVVRVGGVRGWGL